MMTRARWCYALLVVLTFLLAPVGAQKGGGGGKKPTSEPATATFRCPGLECPLSADPDGIQADGFDRPYTTGEGAILTTTGEFELVPKPGGRHLTLDFTTNPVPCPLGPCRRDFSAITLGADEVLVFRTNTLNPDTGEEASDGLRSIPPGDTWRARLLVAFNTLDGVAWGVRFNTAAYAPSEHIWAYRQNADTWILYATDQEEAMLLSSCCRQKGRTNEGLYVMTFSVTITTP